MTKWIHCDRCGRNKPNCAKGLCKQCYMHSWVTEHRNSCTDCGKVISNQAQRCNGCATRKRWAEGVFDEEYRQRLSVAIKQSWANGDYDSEETRRRRSESAKARFARGDIEGLFTEEWRQNNAESKRKAWREGRLGGEEWCHKNAEGVKQAYRTGCYDHLYIPGSTLELEIIAALDICGIEYLSQYRPPNCTYFYDEFIPGLNLLLEIDGWFWHHSEIARKRGSVRRDRAKDVWAVENGYRLMRLQEEEIKKQGAWSLVIERVLPLL